VSGHGDRQTRKTFPESASLDVASVMYQSLHDDCDRVDIATAFAMRA